MFDAEQLRECVIRPTLVTIGLHSAAAEDLVVGTWATESSLGTYLVQRGNGPALGVAQMEPFTHDDIWANYLRHRSADVALMKGMVGSRFWDTDKGRPDPQALVVSLDYAAAMTRYHYRRVPQALPRPGDWAGLAAYYKRYYNTPAGKGSEAKFLADCERCGVIA